MYSFFLMFKRVVQTVTTVNENVHLLQLAKKRVQISRCHSIYWIIDLHSEERVISISELHLQVGMCHQKSRTVKLILIGNRGDTKPS